MICHPHMNYCLVENPEQCCKQQGRGYNLATLERRHLPKKWTKSSKTELCRHSSQGKEILNIMKPIYARDTPRNIWITGTVLDRPQSIREPKTYLINFRGKVYKRTKEHFKPRPTTNITNIPRQEILSPAPNTDTTQKKEGYYDGNCKQRIKHTKKSSRISNHTKRKTTNINSTENIPATKLHNEIGKGYQDNKKIQGLKDVIQL